MKIKKADIILILALCTVSLSAMLITKLIPLSDPKLTVYLPSGEAQSYSLSGIEGYRDITVAENVVIRLENGQACFITSDCRDKTCVNCGWLKNSGDYAACLPNKVAICITNGQEGKVDAVV